MSFGIRYRPGTDLARRFGDRPAGCHETRAAAEGLLRYCVNAADMEVVELPDPEPTTTTEEKIA